MWAYDFVFERTREGRPLKLLTVVDEFIRRCLAIEVACKQSSRDVLRMLAGLMLRLGKIGENHWAAVCAHRGDTVRIISVRRARKQEIDHYESQ